MKLSIFVFIFALTYSSTSSKASRSRRQAISNEDVVQISTSWRQSILEHLPDITALSANVFSPSTTEYVSNREANFRKHVQGLMQKFFPGPFFDTIYKSLSQQIDCFSNNSLLSTNEIVQAQSLSSDVELIEATNVWSKAACIREGPLKQAYKAIDRFYELSGQEVSNVCTSETIPEFAEGKIQGLIAALTRTDEIVTNMLAILSQDQLRSKQHGDYQTNILAQQLADTFVKKLSEKILDKPCPKIYPTRQLDIAITQRSTRPTVAPRGTTAIPTQTRSFTGPTTTTNTSATTTTVSTTTTSRFTTTKTTSLFDDCSRLTGGIFGRLRPSRCPPGGVTTTTSTTTESATTTSTTARPTTTTSRRINQFLLNAFGRRVG